MDRLDPLVDAARSGDRAAFAELVRITHRDTYTLAFRLTGDEEDAADVVQETYLRAWRGISRFRGEADVRTWLYRITANCSATHLRRRHRHRHEPLDGTAAGGPEPPAGPASDPEAAVLDAAGLARLGAAVGALSPRLRAVLVLRDVYGLTLAEIADDLGISVTAAKVRLHRARRELRDRLGGEGGVSRAV